MMPDRLPPGQVRLALLDRDGTINRKAPPQEYIERLDELEVLPGAAEAVARLNAKGIRVAVVTNQRGVALGRMTAADVDAIHALLSKRLVSAGAAIDAFYWCPHEGGTCTCRKPEPGMLRDAMGRFGVQPDEAVMVGDADSDVEAGRRAGVRTIQIVSGAVRSVADISVPDLASGVEAILTATDDAG
jgi:D-glycero-D-manno-heptose 1,7-bisphosphate phosphatase